MKDFWIVCTWDSYYPYGGLDNIRLVTFCEEEAKEHLKEWESRREGWKSDFCEIYHSSDLPWSEE